MTSDEVESDQRLFQLWQSGRVYQKMTLEHSPNRQREDSCIDTGGQGSVLSVQGSVEIGREDNIHGFVLSRLAKSIRIYVRNGEALAGVAQWIECRPVKQRFASSVPSQAMCLGYRPGPLWGACGRQPHVDVSLPLFLPPFPSL